MNKILLTLALALPLSSIAQDTNPKETVPNKLEQTVVKFLEATEKAGDKLADATGKAIEFATGEVPIVIQEYLGWHFTKSLLFFFVPLIAVGVSWIIYHKLYKGREDWPEHQIIFLVAGIVASLILFTVSMHNFEWLKISIAPRVFLIDEFKHLIK